MFLCCSVSKDKTDWQNFDLDNFCFYESPANYANSKCLFLMEQSYVQRGVYLFCNAHNLILPGKDLKNKCFASVIQKFKVVVLNSKNCEDLYHSHVIDNWMRSIWFTTSISKISHLSFKTFSDNQWQKWWGKLLLRQFFVSFSLLTLMRNNEQNLKQAMLWVCSIIYGEGGGGWGGIFKHTF